MDTLSRPDERAAGVISGADPYRELELYLEKVNEEIDLVFDQWNIPLPKTEEEKTIEEVTKREEPGGREDEESRRLVAAETLGRLAKKEEEGKEEEEDEEVGEVMKYKRKERGEEPGGGVEVGVLLRVSLSQKEDGEDSGLERSAEILDSPLKDVASSGTQTSPAVSRCSSFTWLSDSSSVAAHSHSPADSVEEDTSSTSSGDPESGIGTSSPPHPRFVKRSETWQRLRKGERERDPGLRSEQRREEDGGPGFPEVWLRRREERGSEPTVKGAGGVRIGASGAGARLPAACSAPTLSPPPPHPPPRVHKQPRSQSERHLTEIEASEACKWLRAAGFPQYAQMYEDMQFPIDVNAVQKDHPFLDPDSLQSLFRRLQVLNKCASMKVDSVPKPQEDDSDDEDQCALSENWTFQPESRRWSRVCDVTSNRLQIPPGSESVTPEEPVMRYGSLPPGALSADSELLAARFRRSGSERLRDGAKAFLRRVESIKSRRRKKHHNRELPQHNLVISSPQVVDVVSMQQKIRELNCVEVSQALPLALSGPLEARPFRRSLARPEPDAGALSDSELSWRRHYFKDANSNHTKVLEILDVNSRGASVSSDKTSTSRNSSLSTTPEGVPAKLRSLKKPEIAIFGENESESTDSGSAAAESNSETPKHKGTTVVRWHSFQRASVRPDSYVGRSVCSLSSGQMLVLRKLALLKLTSIMEKHCPTHRTGWNWELPKFMRKIKTPDYKDKTVFGVPLIVSLQRSGQALPNCIHSALTWLRKNSLDQVGLFRKPGVRSRIQKLKAMAEGAPDDMSYEGQQAYDVADMVKQYFRELPEALLTNKLSETFVAIYQHVPVKQRTEAVQCALVLLPDEHRETLVLLLEFLSEVAAHALINQMTASNLALCLAPSLLHWHPAPARTASASPRRKNAAPDPRELAHNKAAHDCLFALITAHKELFTVCDDLLAQCHFSYMEESVPVALEELGAEMQQDWRGYLSACVTALLKEAREKSRGWVSVSSWLGVDISYKKVGDGHPLRLWRVATEVEAPPTELLHRVLRERQAWDPALLKWRVVTRLDSTAEIFQYVTASTPPLPAKDYCVLRSWQTDLGKGACVIVETSVEHPEGQVLSGGVRGIVLASRYLIEPCGSGRSRVIHLSRVDTKGRTPEWYNKSYGHLCGLHLSKIRSSFKHMAEGPESKV